MLKIETFVPVNKNLLVKMIDTKQEKSPGGIIFAGAGLQENVKRAEVLKFDSELSELLREGDMVLFQDNYANALTFSLDPSDPTTKVTVLPFNMILLVVKK